MKAFSVQKGGMRETPSLSQEGEMLRRETAMQECRSFYFEGEDVAFTHE